MPFRQSGPSLNEKKMKAVKARKHFEEEEDDDEDDDENNTGACTICLRLLENATPGTLDEPVATKCDPKLGHVFHRGCIDEWMAGPLAINKTCPICRKDPLAEQRAERARLSTLRRLERRKVYASGVTGKTVLFLQDARKEIASFWRQEILPRSRPFLWVCFVILVFLSLAILLGARLISSRHEEVVTVHEVVSPDLSSILKLRQ